MKFRADPACESPPRRRGWGSAQREPGAALLAVRRLAPVGGPPTLEDVDVAVEAIGLWTGGERKTLAKEVAHGGTHRSVGEQRRRQAAGAAEHPEVIALILRQPEVRAHGVAAHPRINAQPILDFRQFDQ